MSATRPPLLPRLPVPGVVLEIVIGAIIGPQVLERPVRAACRAMNMTSTGETQQVVDVD